MNRFEVLRGFNMFLIIVFTFLSIGAGLMALLTFNPIIIVATLIFVAFTFALNATLDPLTIRIHQEYFK